MVLKRQSLLFLFLACLSPLGFSTQSSTTFSSGEHATAGNAVTVYTVDNPKGQTDFTFQLPSGVTAKYGEILAFGDLYGTPNKAISTGKNTNEQRIRFLMAFDSFALDSKAKDEAVQLLEVMHHEQEVIAEAVKNGIPPEKAYEQYGSETGRRYNCITGGGCEPNTWWLKKGRYLDLASADYDHFGQHAWTAFQVGHALAMEEAVLAKNTKDPKKLELAYAMNAFACHFLSDRFAGGHMRPPRISLPENVSPSVVGSILINYMHNEENDAGIHVHNNLGQRWVAYGDKKYFSDKNEDNRQLLQIALQLAADQVYAAYTSGNMASDQAIADLLPYPDEIGNGSDVDVSPLFYHDHEKNVMMRREDVANVYDRHWTDSWWGWSTLGLLVKTHGKLPGVAQAELAASPYAKRALEEGLITEETLRQQILNSKN